MDIKTFFWLLIISMSILWSISTVIFLKTVSNQPVFQQPSINEHIVDLSSYENLSLQMMNASQSVPADKYNHNLYKLLQAAWPPKARPGDEGYGGAGVFINTSLLSEKEKLAHDNGWKNFGVNQMASERVALRRDIVLDMPECKNLTYDTSTLPTAGIVLIFTDEMWSSLMRAIFSILDAGPEELITEIILVDDASQKEHLGQPLDTYIKIFAGKVKLVRLPERKGLMVARNTGFKHVTGEVAVFLDGHCEVSKGWLEPLLYRIKQDDSVVAIPQTDVLKWETFEYHFTNNKGHYMYGFEFDMQFSYIAMPPLGGSKRKNLTDPVPFKPMTARLALQELFERIPCMLPKLLHTLGIEETTTTPTHLGCCLATSKRNFEKLGMYDPGLEIWGCENLELSFKTWMCGGRMEIIPCSHIAHMFKHHITYKWVGKPYILERNCFRVAEVWMDQYKVFYYHRLSDLHKTVNFGDVSERKALREKLKCRSFDWYIKEIYPDIYIPINTTAIGRIYSKLNPSLCLEKHLAKEEYQNPTVRKCNQHYDKQYFYLTKEKQIRRDGHCLSHNNQTHQFVSRVCKNNPGTWTYSQGNQIMFEGTDLCVTVLNKTSIDMAKCNSSDTSQQWSWSRESIILP